MQHYPGCLAQALYSAFCHAFPKSNKTFNSAPFLYFLTNLTSEWITGNTYICTITQSGLIPRLHTGTWEWSYQLVLFHNSTFFWHSFSFLFLFLYLLFLLLLLLSPSLLLLAPLAISGVKSSPMSWEGWPRYLLDPHHAVKTETDSNTTTTPGISSLSSLSLTSKNGSTSAHIRKWIVAKSQGTSGR